MKNYPKMKIFYDSKCPLCSREMNFLKKRDLHNSLQLVDIHAPSTNFSTIGKDKAQLMAKIHANIEGRGLVSGVEVFREAYSRVGLGWIMWISKFPIFKQIFNLSYKVFAKYRVKIGSIIGSCPNDSCNIKID